MRKQKRGSREPERRNGGQQAVPRKPREHARQAHPAARADPSLALIYGFHSVREALRAGRRHLVRLHATQEAAHRLSAEIAAAHVPVNIASAQDLSARLGQQAVHQGVLLEASALEGGDISDLGQSRGIVLVLDQITDPHNFGAIVRTASAFGVEALIATHRHSPVPSGVLAKAASGGLEHVPLINVTNLARALDALGDYGFYRVGLDSEGPAPLDTLSLSRPLALVLGAEGQGLRRLTRENCDALARLDLPGAIKSLNVSNACAIALALVTRAI
ncbi:MAG: 23S rRNA (guanosine(2251)-2'-O)-methyltransferase RlmB [Methylobacteriaceae bacterium]|nr:23S rRNA (guanosine(2251)-2'-O)-methyltransferase RlmB [Methylobacteriaceae bacterium]